VAGQRVALRLRREGLPDLRAEAAVVAGVAGGLARFDLMVEGARPWSPDAPHLHDATLTLLGEDGATLDALDTYLGFRDFEMRDGYYRLNGEPFQLRGLLNQAIYPDTLYTPTDAHTLRDYEETLAHGFNGERRHQTTPRHRDLWLADRMGYWLSIEMPSARNLRNDAHRAAAVAEWTRIVRAYAWHPSVLYLAGQRELGPAQRPPPRDRRQRGRARGVPVRTRRGHRGLRPPRHPVCGQRRLAPCHLAPARRHPEPPRPVAADVQPPRLRGQLAAAQHLRPPAPLSPAGKWSWNARYVFQDSSYTYDGRTPIVLSEVGGRACLNRPARGVFAYGRIYHDPAKWGDELGELIELMGTCRAAGRLRADPDADAATTRRTPRRSARSTASSTPTAPRSSGPTAFGARTPRRRRRGGATWSRPRRVTLAAPAPRAVPGPARRAAEPTADGPRRPHERPRPRPAHRGRPGSDLGRLAPPIGVERPRARPATPPESPKRRAWRLDGRRGRVPPR
jgi:hypothetical protein